MSSEISIGSNVVAMLKLPIPMRSLANMVEDLNAIYGPDLRMMECPKGWLQLFRPEQESEAAK